MKESVIGVAFSMHGEMRVTYCTLVGKPEGKTYFGDWDIFGSEVGGGNANIKFSEIGYNVRAGFVWLRRGSSGVLL